MEQRKQGRETAGPRTGGCGHGECTTAWTACRYEQPSRAVRWSPADLDRCEHGRHSIDSCFDCPHGRSTGNLYLQTPSHYHEDGRILPGDTNRKRVRMTEDGRIQIRIGTMVRGEPIWVTTYDRRP